MADAIVPATGEEALAPPERQARQQGQQEKPSALQLVMKVCSVFWYNFSKGTVRALLLLLLAVAELLSLCAV